MESIERVRSQIASAISEARERLDKLEGARDLAIRASRDVISRSGKIITYILSDNREEALRELDELERAREALDGSLECCPELKYAGFALSAYAEYAEALLLKSLIIEGVVPKASDLRVHPVPYVLALADLVGELRRMCLEKVREERIEDAFTFLRIMEDIYLYMRMLDYPDPLVPGLRHKVDSMRRGLDETRALLIDIENRERLRKALRARM